MSSIAPIRPHFLLVATQVQSHAAVLKWPEIEFQAAYRTVDKSGAGTPTLEGNSVYWNSDWDADAASPDHMVGVAAGEEAWQDFLLEALYSDLLRADAELVKLHSSLIAASNQVVAAGTNRKGTI
jgi:hypothetical protein